MAGIHKEIDMLIDKEVVLPLSVEHSNHVPRNRVVPSRMILVEKFDDETQTSVVKARLTARRDQDPDLLSLLRNNRTSAPTVLMAGK